ncbi:MAG: tRNA (adenosine(37)-N6)-threonylcarbamoyltransferase complex ATPase subunit type 1 TsaE [Minisyncoccales bacterium]|jgi:tRNA threonylcarbamoyladenosine biosynthesis protein TsaE
MKLTSKSHQETENIGKNLALKLINQKREDRALVIAMEGDLGGGKTTFLKGFAKGLDLKKPILSPTFVIFRIYEINSKNYKRFYHFDCYRLEERDLMDLGFEKIISDPENIVAIEWSERVSNILPQNVVKVRLEFINKEEREILID